MIQCSVRRAMTLFSETPATTRSSGLLAPIRSTVEPGYDTIMLTATSPDLNAASDAQIVNVEAISAATAATGVTIDLHNQTDGFTITGSGYDDTMTGSSGADIINARAGNDTIIGFIGADTVDGGPGYDTIMLTATSPDLNAASDAQIVNVEAVSAATATSGRHHRSA